MSGEESEEQVKLRADRVLGKISDSLYIYPETNIENIMAACDSIKPCFIIIDSIQTMYSQSADSVAGSLTQIRECSGQFIRYAKNRNVPVFIVAHVTKSGELAGPKTIEHMVDTVLSFSGERDRALRILRSFKNRFGTTDEIGAFRIARRTAIGISQNRLNMILAVLEKKAGLNLLDYDVYVNVVGGMNTGSTSTDLAVALAIYSSFRGRSSSKRLVAAGEVGLTGNLRSIPNAGKIVQEAVRLGYEAVILPAKNAGQAGKASAEGIRVLGAANISDAIRAFSGGGPVR